MPGKLHGDEIESEMRMLRMLFVGIRSFRSKYKKLFRSEPEICLTDSFLYPTKDGSDSLLFDRHRKDHGTNRGGNERRSSQ